MTAPARSARRLAAVAALVVVVAAGCAKDETTTTSATSAPVTLSSGDGSSTTEVDDTEPEYDADELCGLIEDLVESDGTIDEAQDQMVEIQAASPEDLQDEWDVILGALDELEALSDDQVDEAMAVMTSPEVLEAGTTLDDFSQEVCDVDLELGEDDLLGEAPGTTVDPETDTTDTTDTTDPDADPTSIDAVQAHIESRFGSEDWYALLDESVTWGSSGSGDVSWTVSLGDDPSAAGATTADLVDVCDELADYLDTYEDGDVEIEINGPDDAILVTRAPGESCEAA